MDVDLLGTATAALSLLRDKKVSATELLTAQLNRVDKFNPSLNAIIWEDRDGAMKLAGQLDNEAAREEFRGPLHGLPVTVKESFDLVGSPATWGIPAWKENYPEQDSEVVERLKAAGAIIFGKTNVPKKLADWQSFNEIYGTTNNPWDTSRTPGGSSGGAAAALATGMSMLEAGSDIGSSIRNPAHYCGVFGLKPTWNVVPVQGQLGPRMYGDIDIAVTGPMARSAVDLEMAFNIHAGADRFLRNGWKIDCPVESRNRISDFKIALKLGDPASPVEQKYLDELSTFADALENAGAKVVRNLEPEIDTEEHFTLYMTLLGAAMSAGVAESDLEELGGILKAMNSPATERVVTPRLKGLGMRHSDWLLLDNERRIARLKFDAFFEDHDILLAPVCASQAFPHNHEGERFERSIELNGKMMPEITQLFWSGYSGVVGLPSSVGPMSQVNGLPVGYQAIAGYGRDRTALAFSKAVEREIVGFSPPPMSKA